MTTPEPRLRKEEWEVRPVNIGTARRLVERHHYAAGASNTATYLHGLFPADAFWQEECVGVAWWIPPTRSAAEATYPQNWQGVLALSRLVVAPGVPKNAASFLLGGAMRLIDRSLWPCLVTYADEWRGHTGGIYKATNWQYVGLTQPQPVWVLDGKMVARKAGPVTRTYGEMAEMGAELVGSFPKHKFVHVVENDAMKAERIELALNKAWSAETANGSWSPEVPSMNQCAVTALVVQDYLAGELLRCETRAGNSHYWNRLPSGREIDLTSPQFEHIADEPLFASTAIRERAYVLSFPDTRRRYEILSGRVKGFLDYLEG